MKKAILIFVVIILSGCKRENLNYLADEGINGAQLNTMQLIINDKKYISTEGEVTSSRSMDLLGFQFFSQNDNFMFVIGAFIDDLKPGKYVLNNCLHKSSNCDGLDTKQNAVSFALYNKDKTAIAKTYNSYFDTKLGLTPFNLEIISIVDAGIETPQLKTKRIRGKFDGIVVLLQEIDDEPYYIIKERLKVSGTFDTLCLVNK